MKRRLLVCFALFSVSHIIAQEPADALRASWIVPSGTARQQAIGGAMASLGGDVTATFVNPAGLAFYRTGDFVLSPSYRFGKNKARYLDRKEKESDNKFTLGTTGFVIGSGVSQNRKVRNAAFSIGFNTMADFRNDVLYRGENRRNSYSQKYLEELNSSGVRSFNGDFNTDYAFGSSLAFTTKLVDTIAGGTPGNYQFTSRATSLAASGLLQEQRIKNRGGVYEFALGLAANFNDKLMLGGSLGVPIYDYRREASFTEADATEAVNGFDFFTFEEKLSTKGAGINARIGLIYKPQEFWRIGLAFHTPTAYSLTDSYESSIVANMERGDGRILGAYSLDYTGDQPVETKYMLITPYRVMGSLSYVIREIQDVTRQRGFLTADVEYVNYKAASFTTDEESDNIDAYRSYYKQLNRVIDNTYKGAFNFRAGGELKFTTWMIRLGGAYYGNPYKNTENGKGERVNLTGGLGYRDKGFFIDLTYVHSLNRDIHIPYRLAAATTPAATIRTNAGNVLMTFGIKF
jgi:hypothetical protein